MNKTEIRAQLRAMRRTLPQKAQEDAAKAVHAHLAVFEPYRSARVVMAYMACRGELSLEPVIRDVLAGGRTLVLPRCETDGLMTARKIASLDDLAPGAYGLPEPAADCEIVIPQSIL